MTIKTKLNGGAAAVRRPQAPKPGGNNYNSPSTRPVLPTRPPKPARTAPSRSVADKYGVAVAHKRPPPSAEPVPLLLNLYDLRQYYGIKLSRVSLWRMVRDGRFPRPVRVGNSPCWTRASIEQWVAELEDADWARAGDT